MRAISPATNQTLTSVRRPGRVSRAPRFLLYSHDGLGLGHLRRNLSVATALASVEPAASILLATSAEEAQRFAIPPTVDILKLPGLRKVDNGHYAARRLNVTWSDVRAVRASLLQAAVDSFRPTVVLADKHPLCVGGELQPALEQARRRRARLVLGLRDVLDEPSVVRAELGGNGLFPRIAEYYDRVLVYGQQDILDARREYGFPDEVARMTRFCGYVVAAGTRHDGGHHFLPDAAPYQPHVLATAGGGEDGVALLATFAEVAARARWDARIVSGPHCSRGDVERLEALARAARISFRRFVPELSHEFPGLDALVCMGGYNTLTEAAASGVATVCVPRVSPRTEQLIRARAFARRGLLTVVEPDRLEPGVLGAEVEWALARKAGDERGDANIDLGGALRAAHELLELATRGKVAA